MYLWIDDVRPAPIKDGRKYFHTCRSVNDAIAILRTHLHGLNRIYLISLDHDAGNEKVNGGDYIEVLKWMERQTQENGADFGDIMIHIHSMNPVGRENMRAIIRRNRWKEI